MKHSRSQSCCCCYWLTLLLVASSVIYASPESSTTANVQYNSQQNIEQQQQPIQIETFLPTYTTTTTTASAITNYNSNKVTKTPKMMMPATVTIATSSSLSTSSSSSTVINPVAAEMMTIMMKLSAATAAQAPTTIATTESKLPLAQRKTATTTATAEVTSTSDSRNQNAKNSSLRSSILQQQQLQQKYTTAIESYSHQHQQQQQQQNQHQFVYDSMFFRQQQRTANQYERPPIASASHGRSIRQAEEEQVDKCRLFVEGEVGKNELYSPDYPNDYPKNINCTRVITAPKGQIIRLDFRNSFHIEAKEECKFDFLEIRDGQYGFSNLIGKYCGTDFPPEITSKERYLWLHFHSDESIEYSGFTAVYEFIDRNREAPSTDLNCTIDKDGYEGFVNSTDVPLHIKDTVTRSKVPLDCMWRIQVQDKWKIQVKFIDFKLSKPNDCETNFLDIFPEQTVMPLRVKNFCGSAGEGITSDTNILHMRFYAEQVAINSTFAILYTAFRDKTNTGCTPEEYDCEDATCISRGLMCNGRDNCKFRWDELDEQCTKESGGQSEHVVIIIIVFGLLLGGMVITFLVNCIRKIMRDQKIIREHIRQSKESKLDEMGRNSKARSRDNLSIAMSPRQKHSQTSLQILDDVSNRYYREVVPISVQTGKTGDLKEKEHSILRHHHDMIVQTSLTCDDSSTTTTATEAAAVPVGGNVCDMGCQTRESLFAPALLRQKSISSSIGGGGSVPPPPRFSTFGYDMQHPPPPPPPAVSTLTRHSIRVPAGSIELEERHALVGQQQQQQQQQPQQQHATHTHHHVAPVRGQEVCHHHHQHQQHLQQQQAQQQQQQQRYQQQQQQIQLQYPPTAAKNQALPHVQRAAQQQQHQQMHQKQHQSTATIVPMTTTLPAVIAAATTTATKQGIHPTTQTATQQPVNAPTSGKGKHQKVDESKVFLDIRNSAPDVIIMTSH